MTVVHLVPAMEQGGVESVVRDLNRVVVGAGWRSVVISKGGRLADQIEADGGRHVAMDIKSKNPLTYFPRALRLRRTLAEFKAEDAKILVCAHSRVPAWLFVWVNRTLGLPWITYAHGANSVSRYSAVMTRGDLVVAPSHFLAGFLLKNYDHSPTPPLPHQTTKPLNHQTTPPPNHLTTEPPNHQTTPPPNHQTTKPLNHQTTQPPNHQTSLASRIRVISPCVDLSRFDPDRLDRAFVDEKRREWGVGPGEFVTMSIGRITPVKGFANVIRDLAATGNPNGKLIIVGGADSRHAGHLAELKELAKSLGVEGRVVFAGAQSKMPECLSIADEVVSGNTEKPESFGLSVVEALAMGKPVRLLREFGGAAEILSSVGKASNPAAMREVVCNLYGFDAMAEKTLKVYSELVPQR